MAAAEERRIRLEREELEKKKHEEEGKQREKEKFEREFTKIVTDCKKLSEAKDIDTWKIGGACSKKLAELRSLYDAK